jgi:FdhE protein
VRSPWDVRVARAQELSAKHPEAAELLGLYMRLAAFQKSIFEDVVKRQTTDPVAVAPHFPKLREIVERHGPPLATAFAREHLKSADALDEFLIEAWDDPLVVDVFARFYSRVLLQPFAEALAMRGNSAPSAATGTCPFCGARAMAAVLRGEGDGGKRFLLCSLCAMEWEYLRILCPGCGEKNKDKLPVFTSEADDFDYIRIEACDSCMTYLKSIDLTKNGLAVPVVDELASVSLNVWAEEHGYTKYEPNLLSL